MTDREIKPGPVTWIPDPRIPDSIIKAISLIQKTLEAVQKSQRNEHGRYNFASTDDIYAAVTRKMGEVGLVILGLEENIEIVTVAKKDGDEARWLKAVYSFLLATETDTWTHPGSRRTVMCQITGPQTFQAAQSYSEKSFLRSLFKIPTGDMDLDALPENVEFGSVFSRVPPPPPPQEQLTKKLTPTGSEEIVWDNQNELLK